MEQTFARQLQNGRLTLPDHEIAINDLPWNDHPAFAGVAIKHLVTGEHTSGRMSCHLVRVAPGCCLAEHVHQAEGELHEILNGGGICTLADETINYAPGSMAVIPRGTPHSVTAGEEGIMIRATFFPALL